MIYEIKNIPNLKFKAGFYTCSCFSEKEVGQQPYSRPFAFENFMRFYSLFSHISPLGGQYSYFR